MVDIKALRMCRTDKDDVKLTVLQHTIERTFAGTDGQRMLVLIPCHRDGGVASFLVLSFQLICSDNLLEYVFLWSSSFPSYLFRLVSRFTPDWDVKPKSLCNLYLLSDERCYLSGMPLPFDTSYVSHLVKHVQRRGEHAVKVCCLPDVSDI